jgi:lipopolysaccharide/colanic/teichoic acid biosynthesis glycosyltransferase
VIRPEVQIPLGYASVKRLIDLVGAACLLVLTVPVLAVALAAVWVDSGRPLFYRRRVVGVGGREFDAFKVRTMVRDADRILASDPELREQYSETNKLPHDPRITRVGRWLRKLSIDELPQLINVLRGEMSLVGPRMISPGELQDWGDSVHLLLSVRPGITGTWQVSGRQGLSKADRVRMDGEYIRNLSLRQDVFVLLRTIPAVLSRRGAY